MKKISSLLGYDMKKLVWILLLGIICSCGSNGSLTDEPNGGRTNDGDSVAVDDSTEVVIEAEPLTAELRPVLTNGKKWIMVKQNPRENDGRGCGRVSEETYVYEVAGDTVAHDKNCKIIKATKSNRTGKLVWYEENGALYDEWEKDVYDSSQETEYELVLAYTFYPKNENAMDRYKTLSKGTVVCMGKTRRAIKVYTGDAPAYAEYYIEGIGPVYGTCLNLSGIQPTCRIYRCYVLQKCYDGDELIFDINDFKPETYKEEVRFIEDYDKWFDF